MRDMKDLDEIARGDRSTEERLADRGIYVDMLPVEVRKKVRQLISQLADLKISHALIETKISCARQIQDVANLKV
jgi:23S rRNA A2030 N6-methylase RlmJ